MTDRSYARAQKQAVDEDKKREVAYVRQEKKADEIVTQKLEEVYGAARRLRDESTRRGKGWKCSECNFVNYESRHACGKCVAPNPAVVQRYKDVPNIAKVPARSSDPTVKLITVGGGGGNHRCYRSFNALYAKRKPKKAGDGETPSAWEAAAAAEADETRGQQQQQGHLRPFDEDDDDYDDGPEVCKPGKMNLGGATATTANEEEEDDNEGITYDCTSNCYTMQMNVPQRYWKFIIGAKGSALQETQRLTGCTVIMPRATPATTSSSTAESPSASSPECDIITLRGPTINAIRAAQIRIDGTILECKDKVDYTHFISIPLGTIPSARPVLRKFMTDLMQATIDPEQHKIDESIFQSYSKIHLTLIMLRLHNQAELNAAQTLLQGLEERIRNIFTAQDQLKIRGVNYMNDDPKEVHVVYLEVEKDATYSKLVSLINTINRSFVEAGLALDKDIMHNEKLHATVMNSKWRASTNPLQGSSGAANRIAFDATEVLRLFEHKDLGSHKLQQVELSKLGGGGLTADGYFANDGVIHFP